jgi:hypothetical protein
MLTLLVASNSPAPAEAAPEKAPTPIETNKTAAQTEKEKTAAVNAESAEQKRKAGKTVGNSSDFVGKYLFQSFGKKFYNKKKAGVPQQAAATTTQEGEADVEGPTLPDAK